MIVKENTAYFEVNSFRGDAVHRSVLSSSISRTCARVAGAVEGPHYVVFDVSAAPDYEKP